MDNQPVSREYVVHVSSMNSELLDNKVYCAFNGIFDLLKQLDLDREERYRLLKMMEQFYA